MIKDVHWASLLEKVERSLGPAPRRDLSSAHAVDWPLWAKTDPRFVALCRQEPKVWRDGQVRLAAIVQANNQLFQPGPNGHPANIAYSFDPLFDNDIDSLLLVARAVYDLKGRSGLKPIAQFIADQLQSELCFDNDLPAPPELTSGTDVTLTNLFFDRNHLPDGVLRTPVVPVLTHKGITGALLLPFWHWPNELRAPPGAA